MQVTRADTVYPSILNVSDFILKAQNINIPAITGTYQLGTNGTLYVMKLRADKPTTVSNLHIFLTGAIGTPTSGQNFAALYNADKALLAQTADQSVAWGSTGMQTMAVTPQNLPTGNFYVAVWSNATSRPTLRGGAMGTSSINGLSTGATSCWATADTSITTTAPSTLGAFTAFNNSIWVGVS